MEWAGRRYGYGRAFGVGRFLQLTLWSSNGLQSLGGSLDTVALTPVRLFNPLLLLRDTSLSSPFLALCSIFGELLFRLLSYALPFVFFTFCRYESSAYPSMCLFYVRASIQLSPPLPFLLFCIQSQALGLPHMLPNKSYSIMSICICQNNSPIFIADAVFHDSSDRRGREQLRQRLVIATFASHHLNSIVVILPDRQLQVGTVCSVWSFPT